MKANVSNELKKRLEFASKNGSVIATDILNELKKDKKDCFGDKTVDFFDSIRAVGNHSEYKSLRINISCCTKDLNNPNFPDRGNPRAPWFRENREKVTLGTFINSFKNLGGYTSEEVQYFEGAMCVNDKVTYRISNKMEDFEYAYMGTNYYPYSCTGQASLHNSCMRYEETARNAADFYVNFAGASILIAEDSQNHILGRAIVWNNVFFNDELKDVKVLDRLYFTFDFVRVGMINHARSCGIHIRKNQNAVGSMREFFMYKELGHSAGEGVFRHKASVNVPQIKWHKKGAPYMDTFCYLNYRNGQLYLENYDDSNIVVLQCTSGYGSETRYICPNCGKRTYNHMLCDDCKDELLEQSMFGVIIKGKIKTYKGKRFPASLFVNGKPSEHFAKWIGLKRITDSGFKL